MTNPKRIFVGALIAAGLLAMGACTGGGGQTSECNRYIACVVKLGGNSATLDSTYGPEGTCWMDSTMAASCEKYCKSALAAFPSDAGC